MNPKQDLLAAIEKMDISENDRLYWNTMIPNLSTDAASLILYVLAQKDSELLGRLQSALKSSKKILLEKIGVLTERSKKIFMKIQHKIEVKEANQADSILDKLNHINYFHRTNYPLFTEKRLVYLSGAIESYGVIDRELDVGESDESSETIDSRNESDLVDRLFNSVNGYISSIREMSGDLQLSSKAQEIIDKLSVTREQLQSRVTLNHYLTNLFKFAQIMKPVQEESKSLLIPGYDDIIKPYETGENINWNLALIASLGFDFSLGKKVKKGAEGASALLNKFIEIFKGKKAAKKPRQRLQYDSQRDEYIMKEVTPTKAKHEGHLSRAAEARSIVGKDAGIWVNLTGRTEHFVSNYVELNASSLVGTALDAKGLKAQDDVFDEIAEYVTDNKSEMTSGLATQIDNYYVYLYRQIKRLKNPALLKKVIKARKYLNN